MIKLFILLLIFPLMATAQQNFEGKIVYESYTGNKKDSAEMVAIYGKNKVQVTNRKFKRNKTEESIVILDFDKGLRYDINPMTKTYVIDSFLMGDKAVSSLQRTSDTARILSYRVNSYVEDTLVFGLKMKTTLWFSPDLKYIVPEKYAGFAHAPQSGDNNICWLGLSIVYRMQSVVEGAEKTMSVQAIQVIPGPVDDNSLVVPDSYTLKTTKEPPFKIEMDEIEAPPIPPPPPPPPPRKPKTKT